MKIIMKIYGLKKVILFVVSKCDVCKIDTVCETAEYNSSFSQARV